MRTATLFLLAALFATPALAKEKPKKAKATKTATPPKCQSTPSGLRCLPSANATGKR